MVRSKENARHPPRLITPTRLSARLLRSAAILTFPLSILAGSGAALADYDIRSGSTYGSSSLGSNPTFLGGTLQLNSTSTIGNNFDVENYSSNTIDANGYTATFSGAFTGDGPLTFADSAGGGNVILTNSGNTYSGSTTINSGALLSLSGSGTIASSSGVDVEGTFDISNTTSGAKIISLSGAGTVNLGSQNLALTDAASGLFSGTITGSGSLTVSGGTEILSGANTYTGGTTVSSGTLILGAGGTTGSIVGNISLSSGGTLEFDRTDDLTFGALIQGAGGLNQSGTDTLTLTGVNTYSGVTTVAAGTLALAAGSSIASTSSVAVTGTFDISATSGASIGSLAGSGTVNLGAATLTLTDAAGSFSGTIQGSGGLTLLSGTELLTGANTYTGATTVAGGTLEFGGSTETYNVADSGTVAFDSSSALAMTGVISGSGGMSQIGTGTTTITAVQTYTGPTTISSGTLALSGPGSIASSSGVAVTGTFDVSGTSGTSITSLSGTGLVQLGGQELTITNGAGTFTGIIEGAGGITIAGGTQTLSGSDTFTGATTITSGTLSVISSNALSDSSSVIDNGTLNISTLSNTGAGSTSTIISLSGSGSVILGSKILILSGAADTFSGTISGSGGLTVSGGTETLAGANSYTGLTTISSGTLALSGSGSLASTDSVADNGVFDISATTRGTVTIGSLSGSGTVNLGAETLSFSNASGTFSGSISGTGGLVVAGGTETLSGTNSYTGGTTITAGTLQIGVSYANGSIVGNVTDNGNLAFGNSSAMVFSGAISGTGLVSQVGIGTLILTAANTYTGGTIISEGVIQIGNGTAAGSVTGNVTDNGTLAFGRPDATIFGGTISGAGGVTAVSGTTTLTAANSYTGATLIDSGASLLLSGAGSIAGSNGVTDNGSLDISAIAAPQLASLAGNGTVNLGNRSLALTNGAGTFSGVISGTGGLTVAGGTQILSGVNGYTGATLINGGTLAVNGSIAASSGVTVNSGGTLAGSGTVPTVTVNSGGTISPGIAGSGTLSVNGTVGFTSSSDFAVDVSSSSAGKLSVSGAESLAGTLSVISAGGSYPLGQKFMVLTAADGVTGEFTVAPLQSTGAVLDPTVTYDANDVYLQINLAKLSPLLPSGVSTNQTNAIAGIDAAIASGNTLPLAFENLGNVSSAALAGDASQMAGELGSDIPQAANSLFDPFINAIFEHMDDTQQAGIGARRPPQRDGIWASAFTGSGLIEGDADLGSHQLKSDANGFIGGADFHLSPRFVLGGAFSVGSASFHLADGFGDGKDSAIQAAIYGFIHYLPRLYGDFSAAFSLNSITTARVITVSGTDDLSGKVTANVFGVRYETGAELGWFIPYFALQDQLTMTPAYSETASSGSDNFALSYLSHTVNQPSVELGVRQNANIVLDSNWSLDFTDQMGWKNLLIGTSDTRALYANVTGSDFAIYGAQPGKSAGLIGLGLALQSPSGFGMNAHVQGMIAGNSQTYEEFLGLSFVW